MAELIAKNARILDNPLPPDTDLTEAEQTTIKNQVSTKALYLYHKLISGGVGSFMRSIHFLVSQLTISGAHSQPITSARSYPRSVLSPCYHNVKHYPLSFKFSLSSPIPRTIPIFADFCARHMRTISRRSLVPYLSAASIGITPVDQDRYVPLYCTSLFGVTRTKAVMAKPASTLHFVMQSPRN